MTRRIWAVEHSYRGGPWQPAEGSLFTSRERARKGMVWQRNGTPADMGYRYRVEPYKPVRSK